MAKVKNKFKPGDAFYVQVRQEHINDSDPCNKENCLVNGGALSWFAEKYGDRKMKSTHHGIIFQLNGWKYVAVFDTKTAFRIYKYDQAFRSTHIHGADDDRGAASR